MTVLRHIATNHHRRMLYGAAIRRRYLQIPRVQLIDRWGSWAGGEADLKQLVRRELVG